MPKPKENLTTSVIIITRNRAKSLAACLSSIEKQSLLPTEVLVVDNASKDLTKKAVEKFHKSLHIVYLYEPRIGMPIARNTGMKRAQGEIILMLDDDCIAHTDWIAQASRSHMKYPHAWAMQGKVISIPRESIYSLVLQQQRNVRIKMSTLKHGGILYLDTANCSFKRARLLKTNILFYETEKYIGPDVDLAAQIVVKGGFVVFDKSIVVYHQERSSLKSFLLQRYRNGVTPSIMKRRWPQLKFHFYHAAILLHIMNYFALSKYLLKKKRYRDFFILPFILIMAIAAFELAGFIESIQGKKKHL